MLQTKKNTFTTTQMEFPNSILMALRSDVIVTRQQISWAGESRKLGGWGDELNDWIKERVMLLTGDLDELLEAQNEGGLTSVFLPHAQVAEDMTGDDPNLRQLDSNIVRNPYLRQICDQLDKMSVTITHFDSVWVDHGISAGEHKKAESYLTRVFKVCERRGGFSNMRELITGVTPNDLDNGFNHDGRFDHQMEHMDRERMRDIDALRTGAEGLSGTGTAGGARQPGQGSPSAAPAQAAPQAPVSLRTPGR